MTHDTNAFGGKNPHGQYVPMTDVEMEVLQRLAQEGEFSVVVKGWDPIQNFVLVPHAAIAMVSPERPVAPHSLMCFGDKRISFCFSLVFAEQRSLWYFDIEVWAKGICFRSQRMQAQVGGRPLFVPQGGLYTRILDIAIEMIDPEVIKTIKPAAVGLTTRHGNMHLDTHHQRLLRLTQEGERSVREEAKQEAISSTVAANKESR